MVPDQKLLPCKDEDMMMKMGEVAQVYNQDLNYGKT